MGDGASLERALRRAVGQRARRLALRTGCRSRKSMISLDLAAMLQLLAPPAPVSQYSEPVMKLFFRRWCRPTMMFVEHAHMIETGREISGRLRPDCRARAAPALGVKGR